MAQGGFGGLDTPRTNIGDATYLSRQPDFDISQEASFQSPSKDANLLQQLRNGGHPILRTPRGNRAPFGDRHNLPAGLGGAEFTPLLKSATRNSARRYGHGGKENGPAFLGRIDEDMTPMPAGESSVYVGSRSTSSYAEATPLPVVDSSSIASTPMVMRKRGVNGKGPLEDSNQLSLREQENVIDRIEKENFGLKLKIHFLEEALRKAGPGFSEAALKENTELKVDKVTMQRELQRYKKHLTSAEKDLESYRQQILEVQEKAKKKYADESQRAEMDRLRRELEDKDAQIEQLENQLDRQQSSNDNVDKLQDDIADLEADIRAKDLAIGQHEDELDELRLKFKDVQDERKRDQRRILELEQNAQQNDELEEAKESIEDLEANVRSLEHKVDDLQDKLEDAVQRKDRAEGDLEELQEEMANKSMVTKGLSRQVEEKIARLQNDLEHARQDCDHLAKKNEHFAKETEDLKSSIKELRQERDSSERIRQSLATKLEEAQSDLNSRSDEKALLQSRHDALTSESASLQRDVSRLQKSVTELEQDIERERQHAMDIERDTRSQYKDEIDRLNDEISDLQADVRERENLYDNDSEKWETERHKLESERDHAEERNDGLQKTIDKLREVEGGMSSKESKLQEAMQIETDRHKNEEAILARQVDELQQNLEARQVLLQELRNELSAVRDELRQSQLDYKAQSEKVEALEDEVEVLQTTVDEVSEKARQQLEQVGQEREAVSQKLSAAQNPASGLRDSLGGSSDNIARLKFQLADATERLLTATNERQALQDKLANVSLELLALKTSVADSKAERDELEAQLRRVKSHDDGTFKIDQEKIELRSSKTRLDNEVRRLREENEALVDQRRVIEQTLDDELAKATAEEERLNQEIMHLQKGVRQFSDKTDSVSARRTIRDLERRIEDYQNQLAVSQRPTAANNGEGNSELSMIQRDLNASRQKEIELLQRDASHKEVVKSLKRQISELERKVHEAELAQFLASPLSASNSAQKGEVSELRHQLSTAHHTVADLKKTLRDSDRRAAALARDLEEFEQQKAAAEHALEDAQQAADEAAAAHDVALKKYKHKIEKYKGESRELAAALRSQQQQQQQPAADDGHTDMSVAERRDLHAMLRESQTAADALDRELREHREALEELAGSEAALRKKLERARSERAAYRAGAEKLQRDVRALRQRHGDRALAAPEWPDTDAIVRAAADAEHRHVKEIRGMGMQVQWMQARWERESRLRADAAYAKKYLLLELQVRDACNQADLVILRDIMAQLKGSNRPALQGALRGLDVARRALPPAPDAAKPRQPATLRRVAIAVRFVVRARRAAQGWAKHEVTRQRLAECADEMLRQQRAERMRDEWRAQMQLKAA